MTPAISLLKINKNKFIKLIYLFPSYLVFTTYYPGNCVHTCTHLLLVIGKVTSTTTVLVLVCVVHTHNVYNVQQCYCVTVPWYLFLVFRRKHCLIVFWIFFLLLLLLQKLHVHNMCVSYIKLKRNNVFVNINESFCLRSIVDRK